MPGTEVPVRRVGQGVLLEPVEFDVQAWRAKLDSYGDIPFMEEDREQPDHAVGRRHFLRPMFCLDTNAVIAAIKGMPLGLVRRFDGEMVRGTVALSSIVIFEMRYWIAKSIRRQANAERLAKLLQSPIIVLPFDSDADRAV